MTRNEEALELYRAQTELGLARAALEGALTELETSRECSVRYGFDRVFACLQRAESRIKNVSDPFGSPSPELVNVIDAIRCHAEVA